MTHNTKPDASDVYDELTLAQGELTALLDILARAIASGSKLDHLSCYVSAMIGQQEKVDARASTLWDAMMAEKAMLGTSPWVWSGAELPPMNTPILCLDPFDNGDLNKTEVANYRTDTSSIEHHFFWMRIPSLGAKYREVINEC